jgi:hypothetical protein
VSIAINEKGNRMSSNKRIVAALAALAALAGCATLEPAAPRALPTAPAPISYDGNVALSATDYVFMLVPDANPAVPGLALGTGESLRLGLPRVFRRSTAVAIRPDADVNLVLTKGWPQGAVPLAGQYRIGFDESAHAMVVTALRDIAADGANAPGIKVVHLRGRTFDNPMPGDYPVSITLLAADGSTKATWQGGLKVLDEAPPVRLAPTNFHLPPGARSDYQRVAPGQVAPQWLAVLLWGTNGVPIDGVGVAARDLTRFPKYTGGLLVQDANADGRLDPASDKVVGGIIGAAPAGATGQAATSPVGANGRAVLSGQVPRSAAYPPQAGGGKPNPGLLPVQFRAGSQPGMYRPTIELIGGNAYQFTVEAAAP